MCIGSNLKHFSLTVDAAAAIANKLGMQPTDAEWCFAKLDKVGQSHNFLIMSLKLPFSVGRIGLGRRNV
jgi:hypothetical protein